MIKITDYTKARNVAFLGLALLGFGSFATAEILHTEDWEDKTPNIPFGENTYDDWTGMLEDNGGGAPVSDWMVLDGGGIDWVGSDGATIDGGEQHLEMLSDNSPTGRAIWNFAGGSEDNALPTDVGAATSIYVRFTWIYKTIENPFSDDPANTVGTFWINRFNGSWSFLNSVKSKGTGYLPAGSTEDKFFLELRRDKDGPDSPQQTLVLGDVAEIDRPYMVVTRYDFNDLGVLTGAASWIDPTISEMDTPHLTTDLRAGDQYDTFVNPLVTMDLTQYRGKAKYDNIAIATEWDDVVPAAGGGDMWGDLAIQNIDGGQWVNTEGWLGWLEVSYRDTGWVSSASLGGWVYMPEPPMSTAPGGWVYVLN